MHIGINAQLLSNSLNYRNGGVSRYIRYLLTELAKSPGPHTYTVFVNGQDVIDHLVPHPQINYLSAPWPESHPASRVFWEQMVLPSLLRQKQIDILHSPVNVLPERLPRGCAGIVTLHDLAFLRFPEVLTRPKRLYHQTFTVRSLRHATMLIAVSESTRRDAIDLLNIPEDHIQTVYTCIDKRFSSTRDEQKIQALREKHNISQGFLLYLGTLEPRKNIPTLIDAYARLRQEHQIKEKLVLAGGKGWLYDSIFEKIKQAGLEQDVLFPGYIEDSEQALWYQAATAFVYPSIYEGFGLPVAEALACGTPVVTTNVSSLPEAGAGIALCVDPHDAVALAQALYQTITDSALRTRSREQAPLIAQKFSAQAMVANTLVAYEHAATLFQSGQNHAQQRISI